jgi:hypothetical protein
LCSGAERRANHSASPDGDRYAEVRTLRADGTLRPAQLQGVAIAVAEILPKV